MSFVLTSIYLSLPRVNLYHVKLLPLASPLAPGRFYLPANRCLHAKTPGYNRGLVITNPTRCRDADMTKKSLSRAKDASILS
eukprot:scaffold39129_cov155-Skeletonema_marinoi.AAC.3